MKSRVGIFIIVIGFCLPLLGLIVPFLGFNETMSAALIGFFMLGGPEIFLLIGAALAGKEGVTLIQDKIKRALGLPAGKYPASKTQYNIAVTLILTWLLGAIGVGYVPALFQWDWFTAHLLYISIGFDVMLIVAIFFIGGEQMISKLTSVFRWEKWTLKSSAAAEEK